MLYFAPAFFVYFLALASKKKSMSFLFSVSLVTACTFLIIVASVSGGSIEGVRMMVKSIFPFHRGIYEDYVANFWIFAAPILRLRSPSPWISMAALGKISPVLTITGCLPGLVKLWEKPNPRNFTLSLVICSFSFFFFSWLVHEKAILLPLTVYSLAIHQEAKLLKNLVTFQGLAILSMTKLLVKDGLLIPSVSLYYIFLILVQVSIGSAERRKGYLMMGLLILSNMCRLYVSPPEKYPHLWEYFIHSWICFPGFVYIYWDVCKELWRGKIEKIHSD
jgi:alpha-1,3-glucosyltransferase